MFAQQANPARDKDVHAMLPIRKNWNGIIPEKWSQPDFIGLFGIPQYNSGKAHEDANYPARTP
jgi:hypothetical protein